MDYSDNVAAFHGELLGGLDIVELRGAWWQYWQYSQYVRYIQYERYRQVYAGDGQYMRYEQYGLVWSLHEAGVCAAIEARGPSRAFVAVCSVAEARGQRWAGYTQCGRCVGVGF